MKSVALRKEAEKRSSPILNSTSLMKLSVDQYHRMIETGILTEDDHVELIHGWILNKMPKFPPHENALHLLQELLLSLVPKSNCVRVQAPITLEDSEPEPDLIIAKGSFQQFWDRHPHEADIAIVIEVAESSLSFDQTFKQELYAQYRIPQYWIVDLKHRSVEVYLQPSGPTAEPVYLRKEIYQITDEIPLILSKKPVAKLPVCKFLP